MPRVKIDYVVSFSSEDPENKADNLLAWDIGKKKWLCGKGESSCSVVLQLARAVQISSIHIGADNAALVEVLVGRSETPNEPFQVLVPSCVLLSPAESRRAECAGAGAGVGVGAGAGERVRTWAAAQLSVAATRRWDRLRLVCSQPYNKHCKYGLSFVHVYEPEALTTSCTSEAPGAADSDSDEYRPGRLFADERAGADAGAQIRHATSQLLKNISESSKLIKSPIVKNTATNKKKSVQDAPSTSRDKDSLMYTDDDDRPHSKIDQVVQRHRHEKKEKDDTPKRNTKDNDKKHNKDDLVVSSSSTKTNKRDDHKRKESDQSKGEPMKRKHGDDLSKNKTSHRKTDRNDSSVTKSPNNDTIGEQSPSVDSGRVLAGVGVVLSGYVHPERGALQAAARALGAVVRRDWGPAANTSSARSPTRRSCALRASGSSAAAVRGEWLQRCAAARRLLPWQWFASEHEHKQTPPPDDDPRWRPAPPAPPAPPVPPAAAARDSAKTRKHVSRDELITSPAFACGETTLTTKSKRRYNNRRDHVEMARAVPATRRGCPTYSSCATNASADTTACTTPTATGGQRGALRGGHRPRGGAASPHQRAAADRCRTSSTGTRSRSTTTSRRRSLIKIC
ncbi:LOW QUALITY PROTEIN: DNA repair protein XRCC1 [Aphomia sociella]